jgi:hypothetical protein
VGVVEMRPWECPEYRFTYKKEEDEKQKWVSSKEKWGREKARYMGVMESAY